MPQLDPEPRLLLPGLGCTRVDSQLLTFCLHPTTNCRSSWGQTAARAARAPETPAPSVNRWCPAASYLRQINARSIKKTGW